MKLGQTSVVTFFSKFASSVISFLAILYFSRELGSAALGTYFLAMALVSWISIPGSFSFDKALTKRISEADTETGRYVSAAILLKAGVFVVLALIVMLLSDQVQSYVGVAGAAVFIVFMMAAKSLHSLIHSIFEGQHRVHVSGLLQPIVMVAERVAQVVGVLLGLGVLALLGGYVVGTTLVALLAVTYLSVSPLIPERIHFRRLLDYARYSWIGSVESKALSSMDTIVLGFFVLPGLIGIYNVAWNIASLLALFGYSLAETLFPEISQRRSRDAGISDIVNESLAYNGLFLIPGLVGALALGDRVLAIYGPEFAQGSTILVLLIAARLVYGYHFQLVNTMNAVDHPETAFRVNLWFIGVNIILNIVLIWQFGWLGAAVATLLSSGVVLVLSRRAVRGMVDFAPPVAEVGHQVIAALLMGGVIVLVRPIFEGRTLIVYREFDTLIMVGIGAAIYFPVLLAVSSPFRTKVVQNVPRSWRRQS